ncbi:MAG TPA: aminopeptidase N, partial [Rugosibacter sp.]|nr:aminopeptidase N [Rugosibacter sp.]
MRTDTPQTIYLKDYTPPAWWVDTVDLHVAIQEGYAEVRARLGCRRNLEVPQGAALVLNGEALALQKVGVGDTALDASQYTLTDGALTIHAPLPD